MSMEHGYSVGGRNTAKFSKTVERTNRALPIIPVDILMELFSTLPMDCLVRFRSVCKLWCNVLDDPQFVYDHLEKGHVEFRHLALFKDESEEANQRKRRKRRSQCFNLHMLRLDNSGVLGNVWKKSENPTNIKMKGKSFIVGSSKGVVCFIREKKLHFVNPLFLNDVLAVPLPPLTIDLMEGHDYTSYLSYSFGFDESSKSFKVICVLQCHYCCGHGKSTSAPLVLDLGIRKSLSSSREITWRSLSSKSIRHPCIHCKGCQSSFVDGAFVFLGRRRSPGCGNLEILSFNLKKETFRTITLPISAPVLENCISLFDFNNCIGLLGFTGEETMQIWVLDGFKDITWNVKFLTKVPTNWFESVHVGGINKAKGEIMFKINFGGYYAYNMKTGITIAPPNRPLGLDRILLHQGSLVRASNLTPLGCSS